MSPQVLFEDLNWMDVERYLEQDDRIVLTTGSCEQHGYLSLLTDTKVATAVARAVCEEEGILMTPALPFGVSTAWTAFPGTLSLKSTTFKLIIQELIEALWQRGFRRILLNNGHGGNTDTLGEIMIEFNDTHPDARVGCFTGFNHPLVLKVSQEVRLDSGHANWSENFTFTRVSSVPEGEKDPISGWPRAASAEDYRQVLGDGSSGGPYQVSNDIMDLIFNAMKEALKLELQHLDEVFLEKVRKTRE